MNPLRILRVAGCVSLIVCLTGCTLNSMFVEQVAYHTNQILPEYKEYVVNDESLDPDSREIRISSAEALERLISEAQEPVTLEE